MQSKASLVLMVGIVALVLGAAGILIVDSLGQKLQAAHGPDYQELVGGLGFGPAVDLARCTCSFDPRLCHRCPEDLGSIPGGGSFCPHHACSILPYPPLEIMVDGPEG